MAPIPPNARSAPAKPARSSIDAMSREWVADLAGVRVGAGLPIVVMGVINVSPESFHAGSVRDPRDVLETALRMVDAGASLIDVGARSTAPYLATEIAE